MEVIPCRISFIARIDCPSLCMVSVQIVGSTKSKTRRDAVYSPVAFGISKWCLANVGAGDQLEIFDDFAQDDLTPQIDTGNGIFWIFGPLLFFLILIVILSIGRFLIPRRPSMPANLWCWNNSQPNRSLILTAVYALLIIVTLFLIVWSIVNLPWALPSLLIGIYVLLSSRAAVVSRV